MLTYTVILPLYRIASLQKMNSVDPGKSGEMNLVPRVEAAPCVADSSH